MNANVILFLTLIISLPCLFSTREAKGQAGGAADVISWSYEEGWWDVYGTGPDSDYATQDNGFVTITDAGMTINFRSVVEINPSSNQHGVQQAISITDTATDEIVATAIQTDFYAGGGTTFTVTVSRDVTVKEDGEGMGPFESSLVIIPMCPDGHPPITGSGWSAGSAFLRYDYFFPEDTPGTRAYNHMLPHPPCPMICGNSPPLTIRVVTQRNLGPHIRIVQPWVASSWTGLICSPLGPTVFYATSAACFQFIY